MSELNIIVAHDLERNIGWKGMLPWGNHPEEKKHFRKTTKGHTVVMGRKTYESLDGTLEDRTNIVLSSSKNFDDVINVSSLSELDEYIDNNDAKYYICGGRNVYDYYLMYADKWIISYMLGTFDADTKFPYYSHMIGKEFFPVRTKINDDFVVVKYKNISQFIN